MSNPQIGRIVWANVKNLRAGTKSTGKWRPAIIVGRLDDGMCRVACLTTQSHCKSTRKPRIPVFPSRRNGIPSVSYVWSPKLHVVPDGDIGIEIGFVDEHVVEVLANNTAVNDIEVARLRRIARSPHPHAA